jgi:transcription antitermination factor NusG
VVKDDGRPATLSAQFVASLRRAIERREVTASSVDAPVTFAPDDEVIVQEGPLAGARGVVQELRGGRRLVIWIREIGRGVAFTIGSALVARCAAADFTDGARQPSLSR